MSNLRATTAIMTGSMSLLLLPSPPAAASYVTVEAAFGKPLTDAVIVLARDLEGTKGRAVLDIAMQFPYLHHLETPRKSIFQQAQKALASLYKLFCVVCVRQGIETDGSGSVDARVFFLAEVNSPRCRGDNDIGTLSGPIIDLPTLASCQRPWTTIFAIENDAGSLLLKRFLGFLDHQDANTRLRQTIRRVGSGFDSHLGSETETETLETGGDQDEERHSTVVVGGTFDHLHIGHKLLLTMTLLLLEPKRRKEEQPGRMIVGITGDELLKNKKFADYLESWDSRRRGVCEFVRSISDFANATYDSTARGTESGNDGKVVLTPLSETARLECVEISDAFGPTITDESVSALIVSAETRSGGQAVNEKRAEKGWQELEVFEVDVLDAVEEGHADDAEKVFESKISSTEIRRRQKEQA